jgi:hypothetical protein
MLRPLLALVLITSAGCAGHPVVTVPATQGIAKQADTVLVATKSIEDVVSGANASGVLPDRPAMQVMAVAYKMGDVGQKLSVALKRFETLSVQAQQTPLEQKAILDLVAQIETGLQDVGKITIPDSLTASITKSITDIFTAVNQVKAIIALLKTPVAMLPAQLVGV